MSERKFVIETRLQLENLIYSILEFSYFHSNRVKENNELEEKSYMNLESESIVDNMVEEIKRAVYDSQEDLVIYVSSGALSFAKEMLSKFKSFFVINNIRVVMKILVTDEAMSDIFYNKELREDLYKLVGNLIFFDIDVYNEYGNLNSGYIYIKDKLFMNYSLDINGFPNTLLYTETKSVLEQQSQVCEAAFNQKTLMMKSSDNLGFEDRMLEFYLSTGNNKVVVYASYLEGLFIGKEFLEKLINKQKMSDFEAQMLRRMQKSYRNLINNKELTVNISKRGFANSIDKKEIVLADKVFRLNEEEFMEYMDEFKRIMVEFENVKVNIFDDRYFPFKLYEHGMSSFISKDYVYFKKNPIFVDDNINGYFEVIDKSYSNYFYKMMEEVQDTEYFSLLTSEEFDDYIKLLMES